MDTPRRQSGFLEVTDEEGCRHGLRAGAIQLLSDTDPLRNETLITAAGRTIRVACALDDIAALVEDVHALRRTA